MGRAGGAPGGQEGGAPRQPSLARRHHTFAAAGGPRAPDYGAAPAALAPRNPPPAPYPGQHLPWLGDLGLPQAATLRQILDLLGPMPARLFDPRAHPGTKAELNHTGRAAASPDPPGIGQIDIRGRRG